MHRQRVRNVLERLLSLVHMKSSPCDNLTSEGTQKMFFLCTYVYVYIYACIYLPFSKNVCMYVYPIIELYTRRVLFLKIFYMYA